MKHTLHFSTSGVLLVNCPRIMSDIAERLKNYLFSLLKNAEETNQPNSLFSYFILEYKILPTVDQLLKKFKVALYYYFSYFQSL